MSERRNEKIFGAGKLGSPPKASGGAASGAAGGAAEAPPVSNPQEAPPVSNPQEAPPVSNPQEAPKVLNQQDVQIKKEPVAPMPTDPKALAAWGFCQGLRRADDCPWSTKDGRVLECQDTKGRRTGRCRDCLQQLKKAQKAFVEQAQVTVPSVDLQEGSSSAQNGQAQVLSVDPQEGSSCAQNEQAQVLSVDPQEGSSSAQNGQDSKKKRSKRKQESYADQSRRMWGHPKLGKPPKIISREDLEASIVAREQRKQKRELAAAQAEADAAQAEADAAQAAMQLPAPDDDALAATDQGDKSQECEESQESQTSAVADNGATETLLEEVCYKLTMDMELEATLSKKPDDDTLSKKPDDDSSGTMTPVQPSKSYCRADIGVGADDCSKQRKSLAQRQRQRLRIMMRKQQEQREQHDAGQGSSRKKGEGSKEKHDANGQGSSSKKGEGSKKRKTTHEDDEADESEEGTDSQHSPDCYWVGSGKKPAGPLTAKLAASASQRAVVKGGEVLIHGVMRYNPTTGAIQSRSPTPVTARQIDSAKKKQEKKDAKQAAQDAEKEAQDAEKKAQEREKQEQEHEKHSRDSSPGY
jgi:hypothetical protein